MDEIGEVAGSTESSLVRVVGLGSSVSILVQATGAVQPSTDAKK